MSGLPSEIQEPSPKARAIVDEMVHEATKAAERAGPGSEFVANEEVLVADDAVFEGPSGRQNAKGRHGRVVGAPFLAGDQSKHAGKLCRGVLLETGELITTPERRLSRGKVFGFAGVSQEEWDRIFRKGTK